MPIVSYHVLVENHAEIQQSTVQIMVTAVLNVKVLTHVGMLKSMQLHPLEMFLYYVRAQKVKLMTINVEQSEYTEVYNHKIKVQLQLFVTVI